MKKIIFLAAIAEELDALKASIQKSVLGDQIEIEFLVLGAGVINSVITLGNHPTLFTEDSHPVFTGTAGIMGGDFSPGKVYQASVFRWASVGMALCQGYLPEFFYPDIPARIPGRPHPDLETLPVITTPEITSGAEGARALHNSFSPALENLEAYGIARFLWERNLGLSAFLGVTNRVGEESHREYMRYRQVAWHSLATMICRVVCEMPSWP
ncbi:MAG: hypothetical protein JXD19_04860 [Deltaproteobacteria bacterium]|nr:hypothetical protein [Deltaproteobacteria bacterium]